MSIFSFKNKPSLSLIFDIRDTSISIAAATFEKNKKPELVLCQNFKIEKQNISNWEKYLISMLNTLDDGMISMRKNLAKNGNREKIDKYFFFVGSPWSISQSKMIQILKDRPFEVTNDLLEKLTTDTEMETEKQIEETSNASDWVILEEKIIQVKLNGYKVEKISNKKTNDLEAELFISFVPHTIKNQIFRFTDMHNNKIKIGKLHSSLFSSYMFFRDLYPDKNNFVYIDIGEIITDAYIVRDDIVYGIISFPYGEKDIKNTMIKKSGLSESVVLSALSIVCHGACDEKTEKVIKDLMNPAIEAWVQKLNASISKVCTEMDIPKNIFIIENSDMIRTMMKKIKKDQNIVLLGTKMEVYSEGEGILNNFVVNGKMFKNEPYVKMDLVFLDKITQKS